MPGRAEGGGLLAPSSTSRLPHRPYPPLSPSVTSPPQGGRSWEPGRTDGNHLTHRREHRHRHESISPLVGEMPGRAEGGSLLAPSSTSHPPHRLHSPLSPSVTSPPQGGRSWEPGRTDGNHLTRRRERRHRHGPISPLVGEMPGRAEGGAALAPSSTSRLPHRLHPPLSLSVTSPPQGGRSWEPGRTDGNHLTRRRERRHRHESISPRVGEMPGRAEGGSLLAPSSTSHLPHRLYPPLSPSVTSPPQGGRSMEPRRTGSVSFGRQYEMRRHWS
jgi:hypothetical protein